MTAEAGGFGLLPPGGSSKSFTMGLDFPHSMPHTYHMAAKLEASWQDLLRLKQQGGTVVIHPLPEQKDKK